MEYRTLGHTGVQVSSLCLGADNFADPTPEKEATLFLDMALDADINLIDTGDVYADGEGEKLLDDPAFFGPNDYGHSRLNIIRACENSCTRHEFGQ